MNNAYENALGEYCPPALPLILEVEQVMNVSIYADGEVYTSYSKYDTALLRDDDVKKIISGL